MTPFLWQLCVFLAGFALMAIGGAFLNRWQTRQLPRTSKMLWTGVVLGTVGLLTWFGGFFIVVSSPP